MTDAEPTEEMTAAQHQTEQIRLRRTLVYRLRTEQRLTYAAISRLLTRGTQDPNTGEMLQFDLAPKTALGDYWHVLRENGYVTDPSEVEMHRAEEIEKCEALEKAYWVEAIAGNARAANVVLRAMRTRESLLGLTQVAVTGPGGGPVQVQVSIPDDALAEMVAAARARQAEAEPSMN